MSVTKKVFGVLPDGTEAEIYHLENSSGAYAEVLSYGAILVKLCVPDSTGTLRDVVLGYDELKDYEKNSCYFGATIGRNGNRIEGASFVLNGRKVQLTPNENGNSLHSGPDGFEKKLWSVTEQTDSGVVFSRISADGENGFPGKMKISVGYEWTEDQSLRIHYHAFADQDTVANFTNHSYFNLNGEGSGSILKHELEIFAQEFTPVRDSSAIPLGVAAPVEGTPMDFRAWKQIGAEIGADFEQLKFTGGYDHNYVTDQYESGKVRVIAKARSMESGIEMTVSSDQPCVQFYAGNFINDETGKGGHLYHNRDGFALETQVEPNAVNVKAFHSPILKAGEVLDSVTAYHFETV